MCRLDTFEVTIFDNNRPLIILTLIQLIGTDLQIKMTILHKIMRCTGVGGKGQVKYPFSDAHIQKRIWATTTATRIRITHKKTTYNVTPATKIT